MGMFGFDEQATMFDVTPVENHFLLEYMPTAKGDYVKVYLYGLMHCYHPQEDMSIAQTARELGMTENEVMQAFRHWERCRLVQRISDNPPAFRYVNVKQQFFMGTALPEDKDYEDFAELLYAAFDNERRLHGKEISLCYEWVEDLGLSPEVVVMLIRHMIGLRGKNFAISSAQKLAATLAEQHAVTADDAEMILGREKQVWDGSRRLLRRMGKRREPSEDEMNLYMKWLRDWGYSSDAIEAACAETTKGEPTFAYLDGILRGMMQRSGKAASSRQELERAKNEEQERIAPLKNLLSVLGVQREVSINAGTLAVYDEMRSLYTDDIILLAANECARRGHKLDKVLEMLESWKRKGLQNRDEVEGYIRQFNQQGKLLAILYEIWGKQTKANAADRALLQKWQDEWGFDRDFIAYCAMFAAGAEKPVPYLDSILEDFHQNGVTTPEAANAARSAYQQREQKTPVRAAAQRPMKTVREQNYEQRPYENDTTMPDWLKARLEAMDDDA